ncbi:DUF11 domain-containing protein, partial [Candidatus Gracilibacteria bacterium]|nr:DUF11 domain-containing protein [Candidatus Gracilibacteria bacterium]
TYTFKVKNSGTSPLTGITLTDPLVSDLSCPKNSLNAGEKMTCTATKQVTQNDIDTLDKITNTASVVTAEITTPVTAKAETTITKNPDISLKKEAGNLVGLGYAGDEIGYTFTVKNKGNVTLKEITVTDDKVANITCDVTTLVPNATATCTGDNYVITQADIESGNVVNTAEVSSKAPDDSEVKDKSGTEEGNNEPTQTTVPFISKVNLKKTVNKTTIDGPQTLTYTFVIKNEGNRILKNFVISDDLEGLTDVDCNAITELAPKSSKTCTKTKEITQDDINLGNDIVNTASLKNGNNVLTETDNTDNTATTTITQTPKISLIKTGVLEGEGYAGDIIKYTFTVKNKGNVTLKDISVSDNKLTNFSCTQAKLEPNETKICEAEYTLTQADIDAGQVENRAEVTAKDPQDNNVTDESGKTEDDNETTVTEIPEVKKVNLTKTVDKTEILEPTTLAYTFVIKNEGNKPLKDFRVEDVNVTNIDCNNITEIAPKGIITCSATKEITQADIDSGVDIVNTASVQSAGTTVTETDDTDNTVTTTITQSSKITLVKNIGKTIGKGYAGDKIVYKFVAKNKGNVTLTNVVISDPKLTGVTCPKTELAPKESMTCTGDEYTIKQEEVEAERVENSATVTAQDPKGNEKTDVSGETEDDDNATVTGVPFVEGFNLKKTVDKTNILEPTTLNYTFTLKNTGNKILKDFEVKDELTGVSNIDCKGITEIQPKKSIECSATKEITQTEIDLGEDIINTATAQNSTGTPIAETGDSSMDDNTVTTTITQNPKISLIKTGVLEGEGYKDDIIKYGFTIRNEGNVTLSEIKISDAKIVGEITCDATELAPNAETTCTADYTLTQDDVEAGKVENSAEVSAKSPKNVVVKDTSGPTTDSDDKTVTKIKEIKKVNLTKTVNKAEIAELTTLTYTFVIENTGNKILKDFVIKDGLSGLSTIDCKGKTEVEPKSSITCTATKQVTQDEIDLGSDIVNTATITVNGVEVEETDTSDNTATTSITQKSKIDFDKTVTTTGNEKNIAVGDVLTYSFKVENTGNVTIKNIKVADPMEGLSEITPTSVEKLLPGSETTFTATYTVTQKDVDADHVSNTAKASGVDPKDETVESNESTARLPAIQEPSLNLEKTVSSTGDAKNIAVGDVLTYSFKVENTGNVTMKNITVTDPMEGLSEITPTSVEKLLPGSETTFTATYTVTQKDVDADHVSNTAKASGVDPKDETIESNESTARLPAIQEPSLELEKTVATTGDAKNIKVGDELTYSFKVENTGNVTMKNITIADPMEGLSAITPTSVEKLLPGKSTTFTATYTVTQKDVDADHVSNTAKASGVDPKDQTVESNESTARLPAIQEPSLELEKTVTSTGDAKNIAVGDVLTYSFKVENTGNVTMKNIKVADPMKGLSAIQPEKVEKLLPGKSTTFTATYTVTQKDVDADHVSNTAKASGVDPKDETVESNESTARLPAIQEPSLELEKTVTTTGDAKNIAVGDVLTYSFKVENTGNVTMKNIIVTDPMEGLSEITPTSVEKLLPGGETTFTATYTVTQKDVDADHVSNTAKASGVDPKDETVESNESTARLPAIQEPSLELEKTVSSTGDAKNIKVGDELTYSFKVENTGNVTMKNITVTDPMEGLSEITPTSVEKLLPGKSTTFTATYTVTQKDVDADHVSNTAKASGVDPKDETIESNESTARLPAIQEPNLLLLKTSKFIDDNGTTGHQAGDHIKYTFTVKNTGNVTMKNIIVQDTLKGIGKISPEKVESLAPNKTTIFHATYTVTQKDIDTGKIENTASVSGVDPKGKEVKKKSQASENDQPGTSTVTEIDRKPELEVEDGTIIKGSKFDLKKFVVSATDEEEGNIFDKVEVIDTDGFDPNVPGRYTITYRLVDKSGNVIIKKNTVWVKARGSSPANLGKTKDNPNVVVPEKPNIPEVVKKKDETEPKKEIIQPEILKKVEVKQQNPPKKVLKKEEVIAIKNKIKTLLDITDKELYELLTEKDKNKKIIQIKEFLKRKQQRLEETRKPKVEKKPLNDIIKYPKQLPKTGVQDDIFNKVGHRRNKLIDTYLPSSEVFRLAGTTKTDINHWLQVLPEQDKHLDKYIVLPKSGLVMPIQTVQKKSLSYTNFIYGKEENFKSYLHNGAVEIPATSKKGYGEEGNKVIAGHSSYWKKDNGRYSTHFQKIITTSIGEEVWIYEKNTKTGLFERYVYKITKSYNTDKSDISVLYPTREKILTLFTCTPIGGISGRWIVRAEYVDKK